MNGDTNYFDALQVDPHFSINYCRPLKNYHVDGRQDPLPGVWGDACRGQLKKAEIRTMRGLSYLTIAYQYDPCKMCQIRAKKALDEISNQGR